MTTHYLACDLGAESGRLMLGSLSEGRLALDELHRFPNIPVRKDGALTWNISQLFAELKVGLKIAAGRRLPISSLSTDSWGVDYLLVDEGGSILEPVYHYRDGRTARGMAKVQERIDASTIFEETGIQFMPLNTIYQLAAEPAERLAGARRMLMIADAFNAFLGGQWCVEESNASTTQLYNPRTRSWSKRLLGELNLPAGLFPPVVPSGRRIGHLKSALMQETGLLGIEIVAGCSHDTGAAVAAVPATGEGWAYLSSGTWSLMGVELQSPLVTDACRQLNFTNEIGYGGSIRLLKNISGMWLVQECRRQWANAGQEFDYASLTELASAAQPFVSLIQPADPRFLAPADMVEAIGAFCRDTHQPVPASPGAYVRCALESLALLYRRTLEQLGTLTGRRIERLHIVGGGSRNGLLNQFTANALRIPVLAGPIEATAAGNVLIQSLAMGHLDSLASLRSVVRSSFDLTTFAPTDPGPWDAAYQRFSQFFG